MPPERSHAAASGAAPSACTAWNVGDQPAPWRPSPRHVGERSPADLHEDPVEPGARRPGLGGDLPTDGAAAVEAQGVLRPLHRERDRAGVDRLAEPEHCGVAARIAGRPLAPVDVRAQRDEAFTDRLAHPRRYVHLDRPARRSGEGRRRDGGVATRGDRQWRTLVEQADRFRGEQVEQDRHEMAGLVAAADRTGLVLDPHPPAVDEAQFLRQAVGTPERCQPESLPVDLGH